MVLPAFHRLMGKCRALLGLAVVTGAMGFNGVVAAGLGCDSSSIACKGGQPRAPVADFGPNPGELLMYLHVPKGLPAGRPLVVALHGCQQQASNYTDGSGWTALADHYAFALLLPQQRQTNNPHRCFNWFQLEDVQRHDAGGALGEAASIWAMIQKMQATYQTDPQQVYITGLSAGGAMAAALLAAYPEIFQGGAIIAGIPFGCAQDIAAAFSCMKGEKDQTPQAWGDQVRAAAIGHTAGRGRPKVAIWHGLADSVVHPANADALVDEWTNVLGIDSTPDQADTINEAIYQGYVDSKGTVWVEKYLIPDMDHGVAIDPTQGCGKAAPYILDKGICSSQRIVTFWGIDH